MKIFSHFRFVIFIKIAIISCVFFSLIQITPAYSSQESDEARDAAKEILTQKQFKKDKSDTPLAEDVERISDWLGESKNEKRVTTEQKTKKQEVQQERNQPSNLSLPNLSVLAYVLIILLAAFTIGVIGFFIYKAIANRKKKETDIDTADDEINIDEIQWDDEEKVLGNIDDADLLDSLSDKAFSEGRFDIALRYRFRAGLLRLDKIALITFHPSITNNSYQLMLNNMIFNSLVKTFNDVTYGKYICNATIAQAAKDSWQLLLKEYSNLNKIVVNNKEGKNI